MSLEIRPGSHFNVARRPPDGSVNPGAIPGATVQLSRASFDVMDVQDQIAVQVAFAQYTESLPNREVTWLLDRVRNTVVEVVKKLAPHIVRPNSVET
jgi:hypothetical protein